MARRHVVGAALGAVHLALVVALGEYIQSSGEAQAPLHWIFMAALDFPVSLLLLLDRFEWVATLAERFDWFYLFHAVVGTAWWCCLPALVRRVEMRLDRERA